MSHWSYLKKGDLIDLVAPGSACSIDEVQKSVAALESLGFRARIPKNLFSGHPLLASDDQTRFAILKKAIEAKDSRAIWSVRGGYGSIRLLPLLKGLKKPKVVKALLGYSDVTTLHHFVYTKWGWPSLHSSLFDRFGSDKMSEEQRVEILDILEGHIASLEFSGLKSLNKSGRSKKAITAPIVGGNLCVLNSTLGTDFQMKASGHMLFLEDIGERPHRVDRMLEQMKQAGVFKNCRAILLGDFLLESHDKELLWSDVFMRFAESVAIPVLTGLPVGHGNVQKTLPLGVKAKLLLSAQGATLTVATGGRAE